MKDIQTENKVEMKSSFISIRVKETEWVQLSAITSKCKDIGLNVGLSTIIRKVYDLGLKSVSLDDYLDNPLSLFIETQVTD